MSWWINLCNNHSKHLPNTAKVITKLSQKLYIIELKFALFFCRAQEGLAYTRVFNFSRSVCLSVSTMRKRLLHAHYILGPKIFTDSEPSIKCQLGVPIRGARPQIMVFWGVWLIDLSDPHRVKYFGKPFTSNVILVILGQYPNPLTP